jgi:translation initiation factor 2 subunit 2
LSTITGNGVKLNNNANEYEILLHKALSDLPHLSEENIDFKIPEVDSIIQGSRTIIKNFNQIADVARRPKEEIETFLTKELAAHINEEDNRIVISAKVSPEVLKSKIAKYFDSYVICKECHKPDTHTESISRGFITLVCEACGARYTVKY